MNKFVESFYFSCLMIFISFLVSYLTDYLNNKKIILFPEYGLDMIKGTFISSIITYNLFFNSSK